MTDYITNGKLGGWLDVRDEVLEKYSLDLDSMTREFIWATNQQHSQGVGLEAFNGVTASYAAASATDAMGTAASGLTFFDKIQDGNFQLWVYDSNGDVVTPGGDTITIDADTTRLTDVAAQIGAADANITAAVIDGRLEISAANGYTFAFGGDNSNTLAALGINTFFEGSTAGGMDVCDAIRDNFNLIAAGRIDATGVFATGDNANAVAITDLQFATMDIPNWSCDRIDGNTPGSITASVGDYYRAFVGSLGTISESLTRERAFDEVSASKIGEIRDSLSAVSLDEEMTNLMKFQHAYTAAAKLITTADEMLATLLELK